MKIHIISKTNSLWLTVADYAETCSWDACARLAAFMKDGIWGDRDRIFVAEESGGFVGLCALIKTQGSPMPEYSPLVKWLFVDEKCRGRRIGGKLLDAAAEYAKGLGYCKIFLTTWHIGLYEKYGFVKIGDIEVRSGYFEGIYERRL